MDKSNKTAVITGVSSGIGLALTKKLLEENYNVIGTTRTGNLSGFSHPNLEVVQLEATEKSSGENAVKQILEISDNIDLLVNNAGAAPDIFSIDPQYDSFTQTINTNITGVVFFTEPLLAHINAEGKVAFISSNMGLPRNAAPNGPGYRLSKAAINMYAAILATRLSEKGITVTSFHPGWVQTKLGGDQAPLTTKDSADGLYTGIINNNVNGKFWDITIPGIDSF
ncbi:SDR family NAD(P)-dependent oxidoreductase [Mucilaginibacter polytrichastri]|uniref:C-factor n=1 Tax=Mucilaginibacter polytrichastri TaxID=1302689 RepID=A0A1Q6A215_9SPHI|nr:SDR family NAD(P)-dependent oxidoreductase [Mucilaginibacter polytrichastri]OKS88056.1 hypothetical protein RG47T_3520 [Mucilaginibacter polytrichastri]SFT10128.1 NAD(P)-dependent dehydrogenase, short-chain alcohol dehydrogenase family [Mucilaginibacter polytrichastri]